MDLVFPDTPEYHFILKGLCSNVFATYPKFRCDPKSNFEDKVEGDIVFVPAPVAVLNSDRYIVLKSGGIFSYFSGSSIFSSENQFDTLYVRRRDFVSVYYAKLLLTDKRILRGEGFPALIEPRLSFFNVNSPQKVDDLYKRWSKAVGNLPFPLYVGMIEKELKESKELLENAINSSIKYSLDNFSSSAKEIALSFHIENLGMLKRAILHFVNKNTMTMGDDEIDALMALNNEMKNSGYPVHELVF